MCARVEAMATMQPRVALRSAAAALASRNVAVRLVASTSFQLSSVVCASGANLPMPALDTTASMRPARARATATSRSTSASSRRSTATPAAPVSAAAALTASPSTSARITCQPRRASPPATARPMPRAAPVTIAARSPTLDVLHPPGLYRPAWHRDQKFRVNARAASSLGKGLARQHTWPRPRDSIGHLAWPSAWIRVRLQGRRRSRMATDSFDYIIVGAGTAGCLLANRLSAAPQTRVLLLEAGGTDSYHWIHIPVGYLYLLGNPRADWCFNPAAEPGLNGRSRDDPRGKAVGGCSSINGMIYMRGQARDYDLWRQLGNPGWAWEDVLPYFKRHQDQWALEPDAFEGLHARGGEWRIEPARIRWEILDAFRDAAEQAGIPKVEDFNRGDNEGCGYFHVNQKTGIQIGRAHV